MASSLRNLAEYILSTQLNAAPWPIDLCEMSTCLKLVYLYYRETLLSNIEAPVLYYTNAI